MAEANGANTQQIVVGRGGTDAGPIWRRGRNNQGVWGSWVKEPTRAEVDALNSKTTLTLTRTENQWVDATSFGRLYAYKRGNMLWLKGNLLITGTASMSDFVNIGTIGGWSAIDTVLLNAVAQGNTFSTLIVQVSTSGTISIYSTNPINTFYRFVATVPCN